jgi:hypothetical protein
VFARGAAAGTTGKISGKVVDAKGQPLIGASVAVPALRTGAATDADGLYSIVNVPAGTYDVRINLTRLRARLTTGLVVSSDHTSKLDVTLTESAVQLKEVVVKSTRPVVDVSKRPRSRTSPPPRSRSCRAGAAGRREPAGGRRRRPLPRRTPGRGAVPGRRVSVNNAYDNKNSLRLDRSLLEEVQVIRHVRRRVRQASRASSTRS